MLEVEDLTVRYGVVKAVRGISFVCPESTIVLLVGPNGAGKSTTLLSVSGACEGTVGGHIRVGGVDVTNRSPEAVVGQGVALVPEGRRIFTRLTVEENLRLAASSVRNDKTVDQRLDVVYERFSILGEFRKRHAGLLSGGQQQQLAIGRALLTDPKVLLLDEPSLGLSPKLVEEVFNAITALRDSGLAIVLVEQNVVRASEIAQETLVLRNGTIEGTGSEGVNEELVHAFFGGQGT